MNNKYVLSRYNVFKIIGDTVIGVNLHNKVLFALDKHKYEKLNSFSENLEALEAGDLIFFTTMYKLGIIVESEKDNSTYKQMLLNNRLRVFDTMSYRLTINPTLNCNFGCWYCYETHTRKRMPKDVFNAVLKFIENIINNDNLTRFELDWFGGEPLLCFENIMKPLSIEVMKMCKAKNIVFESGITTNGYLISEEIVPFLKAFNMQSFQITLDGNKETHNKTRVAKGKNDSYDKIVANICLLAEKLHPKNLTLRVNFTKESFADIEKIIESFLLEYRNRITLMLQQVWQDKKHIVSINEIESLKEKFEKVGFKVNKDILNLRGYTCYADLYNQAVVNYDGRVFKCTARNFEKEEEDGVLTENGNIEWLANKLPLKISEATFENDKCKKCSYLPVCFGPCSQKKYVSKTSKDFEKYCYEGGIKLTLDYIMTEFERSKQVIAPLMDYKK